MNRKEKLQKRLKALLEKKAELVKRSDASEDIAEVRAIGDRLRDLADNIADIEEELRIIADEEDGGEGEGERGANVGGEARGFSPLATYGVQGAGEQREALTGVDSLEYRSAFMNLVASNVPIPAELRQNENTLTNDVASVIPTVLVNRIVEKMEESGMILPLVTRTAYAAGVVIPTSNVKPVATWVAEGASSDRQKKTTGKVTFAYYKLRCEISMSMEVGTMALSAFEAKFVENVAKAMVIAIEKAILAGDGENQPKGIFTETVPEGQYVQIADATKGIPTYAELVEAESSLPAEYEGGAVWLMTKKQFGKFLAMVDDNGQPIARVNYGVGGKPERILLGRPVITHPYATEMGNYSAAIFDLADYVLNTVYDMGIQKKQDWDTEDLLTKAVMSVDGKAVDAGSLVVMSTTARV